ncbi:hypothetical protein [Armatimonas sp.]|uniref:hypothetical protein n=1 Tax=Armatimonas sp. TaxID=1872638 RepID=UPI00375215B1
MNRVIVKNLTLGAVMALLTTAAQAQLTTFANFTQAGGTRPYTFTNAGSLSTFNLTAPQAINFYYQVNNEYNGIGFATVIPATMTLTSSVGAPGEDLGGGTLRQSMTNITMVFTANTPVNGKSELLRMVANSGGNAGRLGGRLSGDDGSTNPSLSGSQNGVLGDLVTMSSDFVHFDNTTRRDYSLTFSAATPDFSRNGNSYINSFTADGTGTFASNPAPFALIPEPASLVFVLLGGIALHRRRR